jgi:RNA polymerase sigma factor (sigma-70 family)
MLMSGLVERRERVGVSLQEIEAAYRSGFPRFVSVAAMVCGSAEDGREAVQEAFARAIRARDSYRGEADLDAWLWRIVVNTARSAVRRPRPLPVGDVPERPAEAEERAEAWRLLERLPERQRTVVFLRFYADMEYRTIASVLEMELGTVGSTLNAGLAALRRGMTTKERR